MPISYMPIYGRILSISTPSGDCCQKHLSLLTENGPATVILTSDTYVVNSVRLRAGMQIAAFFDGSLPQVLSFPPQHRAAIITGRRGNETVAVNYFDQSLLSADGSLQLNVGSDTEMVSSNGQPFPCSPGGHYLIVYYSMTTRSQPPQATPRKIVVLC